MNSKAITLLFLKFVAAFKLLQFIVFELQKVRKAKVVFFFPFYHTGGAEKVHLNIVKALNNKNNYVLFTQKSSSDNCRSQFLLNANCCEVYDLLHRNYFIRNQFIKLLSRELNKSKELISVFGSNAFFFYELIPFLDNSTQKIDLIHAFSKPDYGIEMASMPYVKYLDKRVVINEKTLLDFKELYHEKALDDFLDNVVKIENGIDINDTVLNKSKRSNFTILFVGRWSKEKRPEIFLQIAKHVLEKYSDIDFLMLGSDMEPHKNEIIYSGVVYKGEIKNEDSLKNIYKNADLLLITSYREGFPMVVMEAMANGVVPIVTNVGGLSEHITNGINGFLIENENPDTVIIENFSKKIEELYQEREILARISENALNYAHENFDIEVFNNQYNKILLNKDV